jgi:hypothetical protein
MRTGFQASYLPTLDGYFFGAFLSGRFFGFEVASTKSLATSLDGPLPPLGVIPWATPSMKRNCARDLAGMAYTKYPNTSIVAVAAPPCWVFRMNANTAAAAPTTTPVVMP